MSLWDLHPGGQALSYTETQNKVQWKNPVSPGRQGSYSATTACVHFSFLNPKAKKFKSTNDFVDLKVVTEISDPAEETYNPLFPSLETPKVAFKRFHRTAAISWSSGDRCSGLLLSQAVVRQIVCQLQRQ